MNTAKKKRPPARQPFLTTDELRAQGVKNVHIRSVVPLDTVDLIDKMRKKFNCGRNNMLLIAATALLTSPDAHKFIAQFIKKMESD